MLTHQTDKKLFGSHSSMFIFSRKQLGISQFWKNIFNENVTNQKTGPRRLKSKNEEKVFLFITQ